MNFFIFCSLLLNFIEVKAYAILPSKQNPNLLITKIIWLVLILCSLLMILFYYAGIKNKLDKLGQRSFECGFTSHFNSRHSFSVHYFVISLIFLFLDLEICFVLPFFIEDLNNIEIVLGLLLFISVLLLGLFKEWIDKKLIWEY